jgi:GntR family transcriptional regulator, transcriptional repressor for pyruvate dehydrogenase complex
MNDLVTQKHVFEAVQRVPSLVQRTEAHLENLIVGGALRPKERMPSERELGERLGVSKTVLREAIRSLAARGLVEVRPGSGTYIREINQDMMTRPMALWLRSGVLGVENVHEVRVSLEIQIAGLAASRASEDDLIAMEQSIAALKAPQITAIEFAEADVAFHKRLAEAAKNPLFSVLANAVNDVMIEIRLQAYECNAPSVERAVYYHSRILDNVRKHDIEGARRAMEEHLAYSLEVMRLAAAAERRNGDRSN